MARLVGSTTKVYCGDNEGNGWSVELTAVGGQNWKARVLRNHAVHFVSQIFFMFLVEREKKLR